MAAQTIQALPYIPGCPLHESCVRALRNEQRNRRRTLKNQDLNDLGATAGHNLNIGIIAGFDDLANKSRTPVFTLKPSLAYFGSFGNFDLYAGAFYTFLFDDPLGQKGGLQETLGYNFFPGDSFTITVALDNDNQLNISPGEPAFAFASAEPGISFTMDLKHGEFSAAAGLPIDYSAFLNAKTEAAREIAIDSYFTLGYTFPFGLGISTTSRIWVRPDLEYGETELNLIYGAKSFYGSFTVTADDRFKLWSLEPYLAYTVKQVTFSASVLFENIGGAGTGSPVVDTEIGADRIAITPSIGVRYRFGERL
ncbi:hypothetical protein [Leadbettera azotonutricia]|nr:hypothetical protein [Leadbettera azotonutricia]